MQEYFIPLLAGSLALGLAAGYLVRKFWALKQGRSLEQNIQKQIEAAEAHAREIIVEAKDKAASFLTDAKKEEREHKTRLDAMETRLLQREEALDKKLSFVAEEEKGLKLKVDELKNKEAEIATGREKIEKQLEAVSGLSRETAREALFRQVKEEYANELQQLHQSLIKERREDIEKKSVEIMTTALQRYARSNVSEITTTAFPLQDEEFKGKIIGREGRNIRALERATGAEFVIDETPDTIIISSFDPYRREIARLTLEKLIKDGRIQPAKIEEKAEEAKQEMVKRTQEIGEAAAMEVGVYNLPKEILQLLGRLNFRTSFGQNVLTHSIEMTYVSGMIASELGLNVMVAKAGALLHDIGKAIDHEVEGTHVELGRKLLKKFNVDEAIINAMQSHHEEYPYASPESYIVSAADVLSAARPGARRGTIENYIKRLGDLEKIAMEFPGVKNAYAISAGRELRVFVVPEKIDDFKALEMAREIANRIQAELKYPGEIKVNVIREMRAVEYAR